MMNDDNIIKAVDYFKSSNNSYWIVFEKMERTLEDRIQEEKAKGTPFPEWKIWVYFLQAC